MKRGRLHEEVPMRRKIQRILSVLLIAALPVAVLPARAQAYTKATDRVTVYSQHASKFRDSGKWGVYDHHSTLYKAGCRLFAYAHAIEWLTGEKLGNTLLKQLLNACCSPSNNHGHDYDGCKNSPYRHDNSKDAYNALAKKVYGLTAKSQKITISTSSLRSFFNAGKVAIGSVGDHIVLAVDFVICDKDLNVMKISKSRSIPSGCKMYVQIIDSSADTSTAKDAAFYQNYYTMKDNRLIRGETPLRGGSSSGREYWVEVSVLKKSFTSSTVMYGGAWKGHDYN